MILFIVLGAILRDVNLLIILAGALLALLLIQWRVCVQTVRALGLQRRIPRFVQARKEFDVELTLNNPKKWLGAWLVLAQEKLIYDAAKSAAKLGPASRAIQNVPHSIQVLFPSLPPGCSRLQTYQCTVERRGVYQFQGTELSTRFPLGLMRSILYPKASESFIAHPANGRLLPGWNKLFQGKIIGEKQPKSKTLSDQGEFFGLRSYHSGDSPRWIHWRSSARTNELMVKQFQRADNHELIIVLDLHHAAIDQSAEQEKPYSSEQLKLMRVGEDTAVEFVATIANYVAASNSAILTLGIADHEPTIASKIQTRGQNTALLDRLAIACSSEQDSLAMTLELLEREYRRVENLVVISTRTKDQALREGIRANDGNRTIQFWSRIIWLNATAGELGSYFQPAPRKTQNA